MRPAPFPSPQPAGVTSFGTSSEPTAAEIESEIEDQVADGGEHAVAGADGRKVEELLSRAKSEGTAALGDLASAAVRRLLASGDPLDTSSLFTEEERLELAEALAAVNGTAELLGRSRIRARRDKVTKLSEPTDFSAFAEPIRPLPPERAVREFQRQAPGVDISTNGVRSRAFRLAVTTEREILDRVHETILKRLSTGQGVSSATPDIQDILDQAGITPRNPQYAEAVFRTNMMESYRAGEDAELASVADAFPVWMYSAVSGPDGRGDGRNRPGHLAHHGQYYPSATRFAEVRGEGADDVINCRCSRVPVARADWLKLRRGGARIAQGYTDPVPVDVAAPDRPAAAPPPASVTQPTTARRTAEPLDSHPFARPGQSKDEVVQQYVRRYGSQPLATLPQADPEGYLKQEHLPEKPQELRPLVLDAIARQQAASPFKRVTIAEVFEELRRARPDLTIRQLHELLAGMREAGQLRLGAHTQAVATIDQPEFGMVLDREVKYYLSPP